MRVLLGYPDSRLALGGLEDPGRTVDIAEPFADLPSIAQYSGPFDVAVLSVSQCADALPTIRELRRRGLRLPVMVVTCHTDWEQEGEALNAGADDVLSRNVPLPVQVARLKALVRRALGHSSAQISCGNVVLDQALQEVRVDGRLVRITRREFDVLEMLMLRRGTLMTKEQFMARLYGDEDGPDHRILDVFICKLRRKLAAAGAGEILRTVWGRGYVAEDPGPAAIATARTRLAAGVARPHRAHLELAAA